MRSRIFGSSGILTVIFFSIIVFTIPINSNAQKFGIEASGSYDYQSGSFVAPCGCTFARGVGVGFGAALSYDITSLSDFVIGIKSGVEDQVTSAIEVVPGNISARIAGGDEQDVKLLYLSLEPFLRYTVADTKLYLQASPGFSYLVWSHFKHIAGGGSADAAPESNPDTSLSVRSTRFTARFSAGYDIPISNIILSPSVNYALPLTVLRSVEAEDWKIYSLSVAIGIRISL
jgi:hypothetical protein